jgi:hypothetical protein
VSHAGRKTPARDVAEDDEFMKAAMPARHEQSDEQDSQRRAALLGNRVIRSRQQARRAEVPRARQRNNPEIDRSENAEGL